MRLLLGMVLAATFAYAAKTLDVYFVDVEGGQATLIVTPSKESILVDTGWPGFNGRDAGRIQAAAKAAGVKKIDYLVLTHYHMDHAGGITQLVEKLPVKTFVDHGPNRETGKSAGELSAAWDKAVQQNLMSVVRLSREALPHFAARRWGRIVNITALSTLQPLPRFGLSVATWACVLGYAKTLSLEVAPQRITVNTICPGRIATGRLDKVFGSGSGAAPIDEQVLVAYEGDPSSETPGRPT